MNIRRVLISFTVLTLCCCSSGSGDDNGGSGGDNGGGSTISPEFTVNNANLLSLDFTGFGTQYNQNLYTTQTSTADGVTQANLPDLEAKVKKLKSQYVRIFFSSKAWEGFNNYNAEFMPSFIKTVELAQKTGSLINITYWHTAQAKDMPKFGDLLYELIVEKGFTNVKYVTIQNEVNSTAIDQATYKTFYEALDTKLKEKGIRDRVQFIGGDLLQDNQASWLDFMGKNMNNLLEGYSSHIYWDHWDAAKPRDRLSGIMTEVAKMSAASRKPYHITEYGLRGERPAGEKYSNPGYIRGTKTPVGVTTLYAFQHALFNLDALNQGYSGLIKWDCYKAMYDNSPQYHCLIGPGSENYPLYPAYYMTYLFTNTSASGWQVMKVARAANTPENKIVSVMKDKASTNYTAYLLNKGTSTTKFALGGFPANKKLSLIVWNNDFTSGTLTKLADVTTDDKGAFSVSINAQCFAAVTTMNVDLTNL